MKGQPQKPQPPERKEVNVNVAGFFVGIILFVFLIWSVYSGESMFSYWVATLLTILAIGNHVIDMKYQ